MRRVALVALVGAGAVLCSCAGVPTSTDARRADPEPIGTQTPDPPQPAEDIKPHPGDSPSDIVRAFRGTLNRPDHAHATSRQFLSPEAAENWKDDAEAIVLARTPYINPMRSTDDAVKITVEISAPQVGVVKPNGAFTPRQVPDYSHTFHLSKYGGEWRIDDPPDGVIVTMTEFEEIYKRFNLYYLDSTRTHVVPDPRYYAASSSVLPTLLMKNLLDPPSDALGDAVRSELSPDVSLVGNVVQGSGQVSRIDLIGLNAKNETARAAAVAQIIWTLGQTGTSGVEVYENDQQVDLGVSQPTGQSDWQAYDPDALPLDGPSGYFVNQGAVFTFDNAPVEGPAGTGQYGLTAIAVSISVDENGRRRLAGVGSSGGQDVLYVGPLGGELTPVLTANDLRPPTWDRISGEMWTIRNGQQLIRVPQRGAPVGVDAPGLDLDTLGTIQTFRLSRDGARYAMIAGGRLYIGHVSRVDGAPVVEHPVEIAPDLATATDVAWSQATRVMVLTQDTTTSPLRSVDVDGTNLDSLSTVKLPAVPDSVTAAPTFPPIVSSSGQLWQHAGDQWLSIARDGNEVPGTAPVYPG